VLGQPDSGAVGNSTMGSLSNWIGQHGIRGEVVLGSAAILLAGAAIVLVVNRALRRALQRLQPWIPLPPGTVLTVARAASSLLWIIVALILLEFWGVSVSGLWASLVSVAAVIGVGFLAVWTMISNITASLFITIWRPFRLGDTVELLPESLKGRAVERNLMFTVLREAEERTLLIPNNLFFQKIFRVTTADARYPFEALQREEPVARAAPASDAEAGRSA
jgi:small-conductance mechanosensitive channel